MVGVRCLNDVFVLLFYIGIYNYINSGVVFSIEKVFLNYCLLDIYYVLDILLIGRYVLFRIFVIVLGESGCTFI